MATNESIIKAIQKIKATAQVSVSNNDIDTLVWENGETPIPKANIEAKMLQLQAEYDANQHQRDRVYPSIGDQLDMLWHTMDNNTELQHKFYDFYQTIKKVKVAHPKK